MRSPSVSARENVRLIVRQFRPGSIADNSVGAPIVELDVMFVRCRICQNRRIRTNDLQTVLAVLQQSSPVNDAKLIGNLLGPKDTVRNQWRRRIHSILDV